MYPRGVTAQARPHGDFARDDSSRLQQLGSRRPSYLGRRADGDEADPVGVVSGHPRSDWLFVGRHKLTQWVGIGGSAEHARDLPPRVRGEVFERLVKPVERRLRRLLRDEEPQDDEGTSPLAPLNDPSGRSGPINDRVTRLRR